jgi:DNA polymerase III subunit alpha
MAAGDERMEAVSLDMHGRVKGERAHDDHKYPVGVRRRSNGARRSARWVSLHHHSTFSYGDGFQLPEAHVRRATELQMSSIALTEHGNISSHVKLEQAANKQGIKPIFGVELYTGGIDEDNRTQKKNHLTILAKDATGYGNMLSLVTESFAKGFYHEPTIDGEMLAERSNGLVVLSGCLGSLLATSLIGGKLIGPESASYRRGREVARRFKRSLKGAYYLEVQAFPELAATRQLNPFMERLSRDLHIPLVATMDCHYTAPTEAEIQKILHNVRPGEKRTLEDMERAWGYDVPLCPVLTDRVLFRRLQATGLSAAAAREAILNAEEIAQECNVTLPKLPELQYPLPPGYKTPRELWRDWLRDGWKFRGCASLPLSLRREYKARLRHEMNMIESKGYENYFLVVSDAVKWAKDHGVSVGPARGSAAASLVAYLLRITEVNPMVHKQLVFERFIDESRQDMPDIDLDFDAETRYRLREYLLGKYGECYNIGTFVYYRSKNALDDVARVHKIPKWEVDIIKGQLIERSSGDLRASATIEDTIEQFPESQEVIKKYPELRRAMDLEGNIKGFSVHAAGLVLGSVRDVAPILKRKINGQDIEVVAIDKWDAERQGLLKMDFLGLKTMTMISHSLEYLGMDLQDLYDMPLDDPEVIEGFRRNDVVGIFQFEGWATRLVNGQIKPDNFDEVCDVSALSRPGPLHNGAAEAYMGIKVGSVQPERWHPAIDNIVEKTKFQIIYQEQILHIVREIGGFDWTAAAYIRKIISKKLGDQEFNRQKSKFMDGALSLHERTNYPRMSSGVAERVWGSCITSGSYAFNFAHSCAYGMLSYWTMWLKVKHPQIFYATSLAAYNEDKQNVLIRDAARHDIKAHPPNVSSSGATWKPKGQRGIQMGFTQLKGIGPKTAEKIIEQRSPRWTRWSDLMAIKGIGPKTIEKIIDFAGEDDPLNVFDVDRRLSTARDGIWSLNLKQPTHTSTEVPYERGQHINVIWMGVVKQRNLRDMFETNRRRGEELDPAKVRNPELSEFMLLVCEDEEDMMRLRIDRYKYPAFKDMLWRLNLDTDVVWVEGFKPHYRSAKEIVVRRMVVLDVDS